MLGCQTYLPAQMALPCQPGALTNVPISWPLGDQYGVSTDASLTAATLAALEALSGSQNLSCPVPPVNTQIACEVLDDFADCVSDLSDLDSSGAAPSLSSVYELSCALSPASSVDTTLSADVESTSPLCHYPLSSPGASCFPGAHEQAKSACAAAEAAVGDVKPLLRKPIDVTKLDSKQVQRLMRRRERNKVAASKCRRKTKEKAASIRDELRDTTVTNERLRQELETLRAEKEKLERLLASHHCILPGCGDVTESLTTPPTSPKSDASDE